MGRVHWLAVCLYCYLSSVVALDRQCYNGYCFIKPDHLTNDNNDVKKSFTDAQQWCRDNNAVLLEIPDEHVQAAVQSYYTNNAFNLAPFLNAQFQQTNWIWADGMLYNSSWGVAIQTEENARYAYMTFDQPNSRFGISSVAVWDTTTRRTSICQYSENQCASGASLTDGLCLVLNTSSSSWFEARLSCYQQGGDLASLHDLRVNSSSLANKLQSQTGYWIGLTHGQWSWQDSGTQLVYNNWQSGSPRYSTCLCLFNRDGLWMDCDCGSTRPFICLQNANSTSTSASQTSPSVMSISKSSYSQLKFTSKSPSQVTSLSKSSNQTSTSDSSSQTTSTTTFSDQRSTSKSNNQTVSPMSSSNQMALALGVGIGGGVGLIIIIILVVVAVIICTRRRRKRSPDNAHPIKVNDPSSVYAQVIPSKDPSASVESSPRIGKELIYVDLASSEDVSSNSARRQTMRPPDILPESFKQRPNVIVVNNGDIYSVPHKTSSTSQG